MKFLRLLLLPFSVLYALILRTRNYVYDSNLLPSYRPPLPVLCIGNLSMGGTGKSPHTEYLIRLLQNDFKIATLSRGYGRLTSGFRYVNENNTPSDCGDEPLQFKQKFGAGVVVAVNEDRCEGIKTICMDHPEVDLILMDDGFQHRRVKAGFYLLLTEFSKPLFNDFVLPAGNLREPRSGYIRADAVVITKCPAGLDENRKEEFRRHLPGKEVFFSAIHYGDLISLKDGTTLPFPEKPVKVLLVTAIANSKPLEDYIRPGVTELVCLSFPDHHAFSAADVGKMSRVFEPMSEKNNIIVTTEKDAMRLRHPDILNLTQNLPVYYVPIHIGFSENDSTRFSNLIHTYVSKNKKRS